MLKRGDRQKGSMSSIFYYVNILSDKIRRIDAKNPCMFIL